ncbi:MAG: hypothetical protein ACREBD_04715 [Blastocatellia bacterium]
MPTAKRLSTSKTNGRRNGAVAPEQVESLKKRFRSMKTDKALDRFLTRLTLDELRALMDSLVNEGRRDSLSLLSTLNQHLTKTSPPRTIKLNTRQQQTLLRRYIIKAEYESLKTDRARDRFLNKLSSAELHTLMWDLTYEGHRAGRRLD